MFRRRRRRRTDWLFSQALDFELTTGTIAPLETSTVGTTFEFLPTQYIDQDVQGRCTLLRIVGDLQMYVNEVQANPPFVLDLSISLIRTEVDDAGNVPQLQISPYAQPALGASSVIGGARNFLWARAIRFVGDGLNNQQLNPVGFPFQGTNGYPSFDLRTKRKLKSGEGLFLQVNYALTNLSPDAGISPFDIHIPFAYRILVGLG